MILIVLFIKYKDIDSECYSEDGKTLRKVTDPSSSLRISAKCEIIEEKCFYELKSLEYFTFEENPNLTVVGKESFSRCNNIKIIDLSFCNKLTKISESAFSGCSNVAELILPKGLLEILLSAFHNIEHITNVTIPASVEIIGRAAFSFCHSLKNVIFLKKDQI